MKEKLMTNLGVAQFKLADYDAALDSFLAIMSVEPSVRVGFSILLCRCCLGHGPQELKDAFSDLVAVQLQVTLSLCVLFNVDKYFLNVCKRVFMETIQ